VRHGDARTHGRPTCTSVGWICAWPKASCAAVRATAECGAAVQGQTLSECSAASAGRELAAQQKRVSTPSHSARRFRHGPANSAARCGAVRRGLPVWYYLSAADFRLFLSTAQHGRRGPRSAKSNHVNRRGVLATCCWPVQVCVACRPLHVVCCMSRRCVLQQCGMLSTAQLTRQRAARAREVRTRMCACMRRLERFLTFECRRLICAHRLPRDLDRLQSKVRANVWAPDVTATVSATADLSTKLSTVPLEHRCAHRCEHRCEYRSGPQSAAELLREYQRVL
jgi:hypothetical protein